MHRYMEDLAHICDPNCQNREEAMLDLWELLTSLKVEPSEAAEIERKILNIYTDLDFDERQAALQILLRVGQGAYLRELLFENLGEIWSKFRLLSNQLTGSLAVMESFNEETQDSTNRDPYDLDKTFRDAYLILKNGGSKFI